MEIPGFYYDEARRKYFKITNGSLDVNSKYHNNQIESRKRRKKKDNQQAPKGIARQVYLLTQTFNPINVRLGYIRGTQSYSYYVYQQLEKSRVATLMTLPSIKVLNIQDNLVVILKGDSAFAFIDVLRFETKDTRPHIVARNYVIEEYTSSLAHESSEAPIVALKTYTFQKNLLFRATTVESPRRPGTAINFIQFDYIYRQGTRCDLTFNLLKSVVLYPRSKVQHRLSCLLGVGRVSNPHNIFDRFYFDETDLTVSSAEVGGDALCLGSNKGDVFNLTIEPNGCLKDVSHFKCKIPEQVYSVRFAGDSLIVSTKSRLFILNHDMSMKRMIKYHDFIKKLYVFHNSVLVVGLKKIAIINIDHRMVQFKYLPYQNDNVVHQFSRLVANNLVVNQSNDSIFVFNIEYLQHFEFKVEVSANEKLTNIFINQTSLLLQYDAGQTSRFITYTL